MSLRTVKVPAGLEQAFEQAERLVAEYFGKRRDAPERGTIEIFGERYVLVRAASLSVEFFALVRDLFGEARRSEADDFARNILFDLAHSVGKSDARRFHERMGLEDPVAKLAAGPVHFSHTGWAFVEIFPESRPVPSAEEYYLLYDHPYSFEAEAWLETGATAPFPVCIMNAGYSSGWCEESFEISAVSSEVLCRGRGDDVCRFIMAHPEHIEAFVERYIESRPQLAPRLRGYRVPDFFARKRAEEELRRAHSDLERRVEERTADLERANEQLRREMAERERVERQLRQTHKLEALGRLAGGVAHDFNNLMGVVIGQAHMLQRQLPRDDERVQEQVGEIRRAGERAATLTRQLLAFGRAQVLSPEHIAVQVVVDDVSEMLRRLIGDDIELEVRRRDDAGHVVVDAGQLTQVLLNLALNARDAMPAGGRLVVETDALDLQERSGVLSPGPWARLTVCDTGMGMDDETASKAIEPFFTTKDMGKGTGLGLSTVYGIVRQSGGHVLLESEPGEGTCVHVYLPRITGGDELGETSEGEAPGPGGTETVLVVEDQEAVLRLVAAALTERGYTVRQASRPEEAERLVDAHEGELDLLVTDVVMPGMSGSELAERLRRRWPSMRVLYVSGYADDEVMRYGVEEGRAALLSKPFSPDELAVKVRETLDS